MPQSETVQKPQPRTLSFTRPNNIRGSVHGKISAYHELWGLVEKQRFRISLEGNEVMLELAYTNTILIQEYIRDRLKELGCTNFNTFEQWIDND
jgi:hypothetical protein